MQLFLRFMEVGQKPNRNKGDGRFVPVLNQASRLEAV